MITLIIISTQKTVSDNSLKVEHFANDWVRLSLTTQATNYRQFGVGVNETDLSEVGNSVHIWGAQVEQQSFATSYIPTQGSTVTRNADVCNNSGSVQDFNLRRRCIVCGDCCFG